MAFSTNNVNIVRYYNSIISEARYIEYRTIPSYTLFLLLTELNDLFTGMNSHRRLEYVSKFYRNINPYIFDTNSFFNMIESLLKCSIHIEQLVLNDLSLNETELTTILTTLAKPCAVSDAELIPELFAEPELSGVMIYDSDTNTNPNYLFDINGPLATSYDTYLNSAIRISNTIDSHIQTTTDINFTILLFLLIARKILSLDIMKSTGEFRVYRSRILSAVRKTKTMMIEYMNYLETK